MTSKSKALLLTMLIACLPAAGQDWPQWRGADRDGVAASFTAPEAWPPALHRIWRLDVGTGYSSPILAADVIYVLSRESDEEAVRAVDLGSGRVRWRESYPAPYQMHSEATAHGKGPRSTPALSAGRLHTLGISGILSTFDAATGKLLWRKTFGDRHAATSPLYGASMSPVVDGDRLIVHVGGHHDGALMALDTATGETRWSLGDDGPAYASPIVVELAGRRQIVTQTDRRIIGVDAGNGELLWKIPFATEWDQNTVTPVAGGGRLILAGYNLPTRALELAAGEGRVTAKQVWSNPDLPLYMSSPVLAGGRLYGLSDKRSGQLFALDAATGSTVSTSRGRGGENAALVLAGDHLFVLNERAELIVLDTRASDLTPVARYEVADSATWAHPLVTARGLVIKDATGLALLAFEAAAEAGEPASR